MPIPHLHVPDDLKRAFRRLALNGNPHWVSYYSSDGVPGRNDLQASVGHLTSGGKDYRHRAHRPYWFTQAVVDERRLGFGFWSRSDQGDRATYRFACYDIEPLTGDDEGDRRVDREPGPELRRRTAEEAVRTFGAWKALARRNRDVVWVLLVESSRYHYHVWALFTRPLARDEHHALVEDVRRRTGPLRNLDKDSTRGEARFGDQFRSPWSWKKGRRSEALASWVRDGEQVLRLGEEARPRSGDGVRLATRDLPEEPDPTTVLAYAIANYPIVPGTRNILQRDLVAALLYKGYGPDLILETGAAWLEHFRAGIDPGKSREHLLRSYRSCYERTLANPKFLIGIKPVDYPALVKARTLTPRQESILLGKGAPRRGLLEVTSLSPGGTFHTVSSLTCLGEGGQPFVREDTQSPGGDSRSAGRDPRGDARLPEVLCETEQERYFVEALVVLCGVELGKARRRGRGVRLTHGQIIEAVRLRHPDAPEIRDRQLQRIKARYVGYRGKSGWKSATRCELLRETLKGVRGVASEYELSPAMATLLASAPSTAREAVSGAERGPDPPEDTAGSAPS